MSNTELTVTVQDDENVWACRENGAAEAAKVQWDFLRRETIGIFVDWLSQGKINKRRELEVFGTHLYRTIFNGPMESFFERALEDSKGQRLRVQLSFQEKAAELAALPWEYLYRPDTKTRRGFFLATHVELVLSRYLPTGEGRDGIRLGKDEQLSILVVVSDPQDKGFGPMTAAPIVKAIKELEEKHPIAVETLDEPTIDNFLDKLKDTKPHILHFIGHGRYDKVEGKGEIALLKSDEKGAKWCQYKEFAEYFIHMRSIPHFVFLHLCEGTMGNGESRASFSELGCELIRAGVQAVVAMQYPITNEAAIAFSCAFYSELAKCEPIDNAVQTGRWRITTKLEKAYDSRVFGTPVLYMHSRDGIVFPAQEEKPPPPTRELSGRGTGPLTDRGIEEERKKGRQAGEGGEFCGPDIWRSLSSKTSP